jgi:uncharacterized protein YcgL (UPF0745 family)
MHELVNKSTDQKPSQASSVVCFVYKGVLKQDHFLFLPCALEDLALDAQPEQEPEQEQQPEPIAESSKVAPPKDMASVALKEALIDAEMSTPRAVQQYRTLPPVLLEKLGKLSFVTEFLLHAERNMQQANPRTVMAEMRNRGFYLQTPKKSIVELEDRYFS